ncbi:CPBP family intramembrane glutamic endopeptidase [Brevibacillus fulvus]|uniref:Membrane protease YdiL (CAAX protease family) n=1 Tax=Brevibacillus fulvus TaxID=1125967 RepID=A0A938XVX0_9BACL|nr:CPBP family intramembrane glutamic endopeptidase [Brevibacillus fulvus]MBM7588673.1 membrane protease YdiL (CAAX protease family) [Brevibacillus fulvus]
MTNRLQQIDDRLLRMNLWLTQGIVLILSAACSLFLFGWTHTVAMFAWPGWFELLAALGIAALLVLANLGMDRWLPRHWQDDGGINERIFARMSLWSIFLLCLSVGIGEEWLFRGVLQTYIGNGWASLLFALIHVRYLRKPLLAGGVYVTSFAIGSIFEWSHHLIGPIVAHTTIDFFLALYLRWTVNKREREEEQNGDEGGKQEESS